MMELDFMWELHHGMLNNHVLQEHNYVGRVCGAFELKLIVLDQILAHANPLFLFYVDLAYELGYICGRYPHSFTKETVSDRSPRKP